MTWNGMLRSVMIDEHGSPELFKELSKLQGKVRAERLRTLALIGMTFLNNNIAVSTESSAKAVEPQPDAQDKNKTARDALRQKLTQGF